MRDLNSIDMESGVSLFTGEPFVQIVVVADGAPVARGQLPPAEVRRHALAYLEAAEAAETDALVWHMLREEVGMSEEAVGTFLTALRARRAGS